MTENDSKIQLLKLRFMFLFRFVVDFRAMKALNHYKRSLFYLIFIDKFKPIETI